MKYLLLLCIIICQCSHGQICSNDSLVIRFKNDIQIELRRHNEKIVWDDETKKSYYEFLVGCPVECILKHIKDSIPAIRAFVFNGLYFKKAD